jgi:hypothetical protein
MCLTCKGGQIIRLPHTDRLPNRTAIDRLLTLPTNFGLVINIKFCSENRFGNRIESNRLLSGNQTEPNSLLIGNRIAFYSDKLNKPT